MIHYHQPTRDEEPFEAVERELQHLSAFLHELLPDPALGPDERLERLARVVPDSTLVSAHHKTARSKLNALRFRLTELVPTDQLTPKEKIEFLVKMVNDLVPDQGLKLYQKLELLGDERGSDNGR